MPFRYFVTDIVDGCIKGTNSFEVASQFAECEDFFVVDAESGKWLTLDGAQQIEEIDGSE